MSQPDALKSLPRRRFVDVLNAHREYSISGRSLPHIDPSEKLIEIFFHRSKRAHIKHYSQNLG